MQFSSHVDRLYHKIFIFVIAIQVAGKTDPVCTCISTFHDDADYDDDALSTIMMIERLALPGPDGGTTSMQANASGSLEG